jgi:hypothetical protein
MLALGLLFGRDRGVGNILAPIAIACGRLALVALISRHRRQLRADALMREGLDRIIFAERGVNRGA